MSTVKFTEDHEWVSIQDDGTVLIGITQHAQEQLGELVYVELPEVDQELEQGADAAVIESVKAASELKAPLSGKVLEINEELPDNPTLVNDDPQGAGWFCRLELSDTSQLDKLMDEAAYQQLIED